MVQKSVRKQFISNSNFEKQHIADNAISQIVILNVLNDVFQNYMCVSLTTNLDSIYKSRDITLPTKVRIVKAMVFLTYGCESWTKRRLSAKELMLLICGVGEDS